jgi:hypothetical protein
MYSAFPVVAGFLLHSSSPEIKPGFVEINPLIICFGFPNEYRN